jgi:hypothetical protein
MSARHYQEPGIVYYDTSTIDGDSVILRVVFTLYFCSESLIRLFQLDTDIIHLSENLNETETMHIVPPEGSDNVSVDLDNPEENGTFDHHIL